MAGDRPFDDGRYPDREGFADCFLCGKPVDPADPNRGFYSSGQPSPGKTTLSGPDLPIHLPCLDGKHMTTNPLDPHYETSVYCAYMNAIAGMVAGYRVRQ